ncbi:glutaminase A protein [Rutstroemia sp. NJR-2017a WRK4]|nr:glutaminase A protein [Rutstroemia sp. NJR-2017a WRK4]
MRWTKYLNAASVIAASVVHASTLTPPVIPLLVRNPYLSAWLGNARDNPWERWPIFWTGQEIGFSVLASVPSANTVYPLLGRPHDSLSKTGDSFDASTTNLTYEIPSPSLGQGPVEVILSFLSPITPTSTFRQSIPASYVTVHVSGGFNINVYLDINGLWVSGNRGNSIDWMFSQSSPPKGSKEVPLKTWTFKRIVEQLFTEWNDRSEWGQLHFTGPADAHHEAGTSALLRQRFARNGTLQNVVDTNFRGIMDEEPVFAFSKSFKLNDTSAASGKSYDSALFTVAHIQDPVIQFASARGLTAMRPLWASYYPKVDELLEFHYQDFHKASELASNYSRQLEADALQSGSEDYKDILALSARQVLGAASFSGTPDDPIIFFKEISSDGNMNTIDVIYPAFPFFLYTNPRWLAYMLEPLIEHMLSGQYPNDYAMHDLGASFPNATGHPDGRDEYMPVEECGNMLIMGLALVNSLKYDTQPASIWSDVGAQASVEFSDNAFPLYADADGMDDTVGGPVNSKGEKQARKWVEKSYKLWKQWTGYLVRETLIPSNQLSTDDFAGWLANQTNLALKGIIGIKAMSEIAEVVGKTEDAKYYRNVSETYIKRWEDEFALSRDGTHAKLAYSWYGSWTILYNLFADSLLCFHLPQSKSRAPTIGKGQRPLAGSETETSKTGFVSDKIYKIQSDWYHTVRQKYGLPLDSRHLYTKSDWEFFAVAVASKQVREEIVDSIALWVNETTTDLYDTEGTGGFPGIEFKARPVVGGHFAFLALERACDGKAVEALDFLNEDAETEEEKVESWEDLHDGEL